MQDNESLVSKIIFWLITFIYLFQISFAIVSLTEPEWLTNLSQKDKNEEARNLKQIGDRHLNDNNYRNALNFYKKALDSNPELYSALGNSAIAFSKMGNHEKAISTYKILLKKNPDEASVVYYNLAEIFEDRGEILEAINYFNRSAKTAPLPINALRKLGFQYIRTKSWKEAVAAFEKAIELRVNLKSYYIEMLKLSKINFPDKSELITQVHSLIENSRKENITDRYDDLIFRRLLSIDKEHAKVHSNLGFAYEMDGDLDQAITHYKNALKIWPDFKNAANNLDRVSTRD